MLARYIRIDSSHDRLAHTLAHLPDTHKSKSDLILPRLARDFLKYPFFSMTDGPSSGREGESFLMTDGRSLGHKRVKGRELRLQNKTTYTGNGRSSVY